MWTPFLWSTVEHSAQDLRVIKDVCWSVHHSYRVHSISYAIRNSTCSLCSLKQNNRSFSSGIAADAFKVQSKPTFFPSELCMSLVHPCAANLVWRELSTVFSLLVWYHWKHSLIQTERPCHPALFGREFGWEVGVGGTQMHMHRHAVARNADLWDKMQFDIAHLTELF